MKQNEEILNIFETTGALKKGHFILRSGLHSGHFFQCARVCEYLDKVSRLAEMMLEQIKGIEFTTVLAPALGGLVIGQEVARQAGARFIFAEKVKDTLALRRDFKIHPGEKILVVEDVITRGGRVTEALAIIEGRGGKPVAVSVMVDRSEGKTKFDVPHFSLLEMSFPTYNPDAVPSELRKIPAIKPGS
ncbi:MAG: orotate phosphoribosyltransferase [Opitutales bacterium]|nr:orotate phosphoribosyltransferase [Opitutales bacterium]